MTDPALYDSSYYDGMRGLPGADDVPPLYARFLQLARPHLTPGARVLDVGCGRGDLTVALARDGVCEVVGLDFSPAAIELTRSRLSQLPETRAASVVLGSIADPDALPAAHFDFAFLMDIVEHLPPDLLRQGLQNVRRWLKPSGYALIHTFPTLGLHRLYRWFLKGTGQGGALAELDAIHCNVQTRAGLLQMLSEAGLICERSWLRNDFTLASSTYHRLPEGLAKRMIGVCVDDALGHPAVAAMARVVSAEEYVSPSLYALARP